MSLFLSVHAVQQMTRRNISRAEISEALACVETTYPSDERPDVTVILGRTNQRRRLKVVVHSEDHEHVITVADRDEEV